MLRGETGNLFQPLGRTQVAHEKPQTAWPGRCRLRPGAARDFSDQHYLLGGWRRIRPASANYTIDECDRFLVNLEGLAADGLTQAPRECDVI